jgi:SAM-dependent methyltransferase
MCNEAGIAFGSRVLTRERVAGRDVLEVGSLDVNGSVRPHAEALGPASYVGVDIAAGPRVDVVLDATELVSRFGRDSFDVVITTEMLEHVRDWRPVIHNLKGVLRPGGYLVVTTRSIGFPYHGYPYDFWRYEPEDMQAIFGDLEIVELERDPDSPGVFMLARRPPGFVERIRPHRLYSIVTGRRQSSVPTAAIVWFRVTRRPAAWLARARSLLPARLRRLRRDVRRTVVSPVWMALPTSVRSGLKRMAGRA